MDGASNTTSRRVLRNKAVRNIASRCVRYVSRGRFDRWFLVANLHDPPFCVLQPYKDSSARGDLGCDHTITPVGAVIDSFALNVVHFYTACCVSYCVDRARGKIDPLILLTPDLDTWQHECPSCPTA